MDMFKIAIGISIILKEIIIHLKISIIFSIFFLLSALTFLYCNENDGTKKDQNKKDSPIKKIIIIFTSNILINILFFKPLRSPNKLKYLYITNIEKTKGSINGKIK